MLCGHCTHERMSQPEEQLHATHADANEQYYRTTAAGCLFEALAPLAASNSNQPALLQRLTTAPPLPSPSVPQSSQDIPTPMSATAPVGQPIEKDRVRLQVCASPECIHAAGSSN